MPPRAGPGPWYARAGRRLATAVALLAAAGTAGSAPPPAAPAAAPAVVRPCHAGPGELTCFALRRIDPTGVALATRTTPAGYGPADLQAAYGLTGTGGSGVTVAVVAAYDHPNAEADLAVYRARYGLPACTAAGGCFRKVTQNGAAGPLPATNDGWAGEIALDLEMVSAGCPLCRLLLVEARTASGGDLYQAEDYAATQARIVTNSWGGPEYPGETRDDSHFNHPGVAILASSGDSGYGTAYPAASRYVLAVGGTGTGQAGTARGWAESAWSGAGSGCSAYESKPAWQTAATGCARRAMADLSAVSDPGTGVAVYTTVGGSGWGVFGGTSVAAPLIAGVYGRSGTPPAAPYAVPYGRASSFVDITTGGNGPCGPPLCAATAGWDGPTGLGTPASVATFASGDGTVAAGPPACPAPAARLTDGGFESGGTGWTATGRVLSTGYGGRPVHSGHRAAWFGGYGAARTDTLRQSVTLPAGCTGYTLSLYLRVDTAQPGHTVAADRLWVAVAGTVLATWSNLDAAAGYLRHTVDLRRYAGSTVTLTFTGTENGSRQTTFLLDDLAVTVS